MPLDPVLDQLLHVLEQSGNPPLAQLTPQKGRDSFRLMTSMLAAAHPEGPRIEVGESLEATIAGPAGDLPVRIYRPAAGSGTLPTVVMFHGGGFVICDLITHDEQARLICRGVGAVVVSVGYRLAPEAPYPAAIEDCVAITRHVLGHVADYGGDPSRVAVAGDSAGATLSAVVAQRLRDEPAEHPLAAQLLFYPSVDATEPADTYPSRVENAAGYFLTEDDLRWFIEHYAGAQQDRSVPGLSPLRAPDLSALPPAVVITAEFDPLRDEGEAYALALRQAGVPVVQRRYDGLIHGFVGMGALSPACDKAAAEAIGELARLLS